MHCAPAIGLFVVLFALACPSPPVTPLLDELDTAALNAPRPQWPAPPAEPRITYLGSVESERRFEVRRSLWRRLREFLTGQYGARLVRPAALCVRGSLLVVADPGAGAVHLLDLYLRRWEPITDTGEGRLVSPVGVACLPDGRIAVADSAADALFTYDLEGTPLGRFVRVALQRPTGLAFDEVHQRLWVAETLAHRVRAFDLAGREQLRVGARGKGEKGFNFPTMLAPDPDGGLWLSDALNFRLQHVDDTGRLDRHFGIAGDRAGTFARPRGLAVDAEGRIFAVDALFDAVQIFDAEGQLLLVFGDRGTEAGEFWLPAGVALDDLGHVFVADSYNQRVQVFAYRPPGARPGGPAGPAPAAERP